MEIISSKRVRAMKLRGDWTIFHQDIIIDGFTSIPDAINFVVDFIEKRSKLWPDGEGRYIVQTF